MDQTRNPIAKPRMVLRVDEDRSAIIGSQRLLSSDYDPRSVARRLQQPPQRNAQVWRYMPFARFVWLLSKKQLWFSRVDLLGDKHEALLYGSPLSAGLEERADPGAREAWLKSLKRLRSELYVSCWHLAEHESLAMWRLYCGTNDGVAIVASYQALQEAVAPLPVGLVTYDESSDATWNQQLRHEPIFAAWMKRPMFAYEREVRVGLYEGWFREWPRPSDGKRTTIGAPIDWDPEEVVARIHVHPEADFSYAEAVNEVLHRFAPKLAFPGVAWSSLGASAPY